MKTPVVNPLPSRLPLPLLDPREPHQDKINFHLWTIPTRAMARIIHRSIGVGHTARLSTRFGIHPSGRSSVARRGHVAIARLREGRHRHRERADRLGSGQARRRGWIQRPRRRRRKSSHVRIGRYGQDRQAVGRGGSRAMDAVERGVHRSLRRHRDAFGRRLLPALRVPACGTGAFVERPARLLEQNGVPHARSSPARTSPDGFPSSRFRRRTWASSTTSAGSSIRAP